MKAIGSTSPGLVLMRALLAEQGAAAAMSRRGNGSDNAMMESFWATLKAECFTGERPATRQAAKLQGFDHVEGSL